MAADFGDVDVDVALRCRGLWLIRRSRYRPAPTATFQLFLKARSIVPAGNAEALAADTLEA